MNGIIQGKMAVLSFWNDAWLPFVCSTDVSISMDSTILPIRTVGDGHWKKVTYQDASYSLSLAGTLMYDPTNWTGFDFSDNWLSFFDMRFRLAFTDEQGDIKSYQGYVVISNQTLSYNPGSVVKTSLTLPGNGELQIFDGLIPCPSTITGITVAGQTGGSGIVTITYTYTGAPYQVKYRIDGVGNYIYALVGTSLVIPGLSLGNHSVEIIPVCQNGYEADDGTSQAFQVTQGLTCAAVCTGITITSTSATPAFTGSPANYLFVLDGGTPMILPASSPIPIAGLSVGSHSITVTPMCSNNMLGTPFTQPFTVSSQPAQSIVNYTYATWVAGNIFQIYVNGILNVSMTSGGSGSITVPTGAIVKGVLQGINNAGSTATLQTVDSTTSTVLDNRSGTVPITLQYSFTANGDTYAINPAVTP
jgi:hypothetical protein